MDDRHASTREDRLPHIDFSQYIKFSRRSSTEVERQVTVCRYRTYVGFDLQRILGAVRRCELKPGDELGIIDWHTSMESRTEEQDPKSHFEEDDAGGLDVGAEWLRALFGFISDNYFRWLDLESRDIYEFMIEGVLASTFLTEYYRNSRDELEFLTYGGSQYEERIKTKHRTCFRMAFGAQLMEFTYDFVRSVCLRPEFRATLKEIVYAPLGEAGYGTVDESSMKTKYTNIIDPTAERVKEILENPKILISEFSAKVTIQHHLVYNDINIRFCLTKRGRVTLYLPQIEFCRPLTDVERENKVYEIVRRAYGRITGSQALESIAVGREKGAPKQLELAMDASLGDV
jgi:hypothetical protein